MLLIPFSNGENSAKSKNIIKLKLVSESEYDSTNAGEFSIEKRMSLIYDHAFSPKPSHNEIKISREFLKKMCSQGFPNISRDWPEAFVKFLTATKQLTTKGLQQLLSRAKGVCVNGRKHVLESLPFIGSIASVEIMKDLIIARSPEITKEVEETWMNSMFFLTRPEEGSVRTMKTLIQHYKTDSNPIFVLIPTAVISTCK